MPDCLWATRVAVPHGTLWELAGDGDAAAIERLLPQGDRIEAFDPAKGSRRIAVLRDDRLAALLFVTSQGVLPSRDWLIAQLAAPAVAPTLLAGTDLAFASRGEHELKGISGTRTLYALRSEP